jgi:hypothetical protein
MRGKVRDLVIMRTLGAPVLFYHISEWVFGRSCCVLTSMCHKLYIVRPRSYTITGASTAPTEDEKNGTHE